MRVFCTLPSGIHLAVGNTNPEKGEVNPRRFTIPAGFSEVPDDFWGEWVAENERFQPFVEGAIRAEPEQDERALHERIAAGDDNPTVAKGTVAQDGLISGGAGAAATAQTSAAATDNVGKEAS